MSTVKRKCRVVILKAKRGTIALYKKTGNMAKPNFNVGIFESDVYQPYHLYILSDDEIKEGDWIYWNNKVVKAIDTVYTNSTKKIIATTDNSLSQTSRTEIPRPSDSFILKYIEAYNNGKPIEKVMVEYEINNPHNQELMFHKEHKEYFFEDFVDGRFKTIYLKERVKINPKDNTITISKVKDSWTREEVINLLHSAGKYGRETANNSIGEMPDMMDKWIEENLS